jgi:membrane-bound lytic murein transglycosylase F
VKLLIILCLVLLGGDGVKEWEKIALISGISKECTRLETDVKFATEKIRELAREQKVNGYSPEWADRFDSLIFYYALNEDFDPRLIKAQMRKESGWRPQIVNATTGAMGLMQLMPATAEELGIKNALDPEENIRGGVRYIKRMWESFREIPHPKDRMRFALASYNAGKRNINKALGLAREACNQPESHLEWRDAGAPEGDWQRWDFTKQFLHQITGKRNSEQTIEYVSKILAFYDEYTKPRLSVT